MPPYEWKILEWDKNPKERNKSYSLRGGKALMLDKAGDCETCAATWPPKLSDIGEGNPWDIALAAAKSENKTLLIKQTH